MGVVIGICDIRFIIIIIIIGILPNGWKIKADVRGGWVVQLMRWPSMKHLLRSKMLPCCVVIYHAHQTSSSPCALLVHRWNDAREVQTKKHSLGWVRGMIEQLTGTSSELEKVRSGAAGHFKEANGSDSCSCTKIRLYRSSLWRLQVKSR